MTSDPLVLQKEAERLLKVADDDQTSAANLIRALLGENERLRQQTEIQAPDLDVAAALIHDLRMARTPDEAWPVLLESKRLALAASQVSIAQHPVRAQQAWRDISEAPKDRRVLGFIPDEIGSEWTRHIPHERPDDGKDDDA